MSRPPFKGPSTWDPPTPNNKTLIKYIVSVEERLLEHIGGLSKSVSPHCMDAISRLKCLDRDPHWIIKPVDKGGAFMLWGRNKHIMEAFGQLSDVEFYEVYKLIRELNSFFTGLYTLAHTKVSRGQNHKRVLIFKHLAFLFCSFISKVGFKTFYRYRISVVYGDCHTLPYISDEKYDLKIFILLLIMKLMYLSKFEFITQ